MAFVDAEHALDVSYARKLGVNTDDLLISQPDTGEQALEITETLVRSGAIDVLVIDSVAVLLAQLRAPAGRASLVFMLVGLVTLAPFLGASVAGEMRAATVGSVWRERSV